MAIIFGLCISGAIGALIGAARGHTGGGALLGLLLGPLGWFIAAVADSRKRCPLCQEVIQRGATLCPHCRTPLTWMGSKPAPICDKTTEPRGDEEWMNQHVTLDQRRAEWAAIAGKRRK